MAKKTKAAPIAKKKATDEEAPLGVANRKQQLKDIDGVEAQLGCIYSDVVAGFDDKNDQNVVIDRCWDVYDCKLNENQGYYGVSQIYVPLVRDTIEARVTRFCNQLFPKDGRYVDAVSADGTVPYEIISLLDHYLEKADMRSSIGPGLIRMGDVTGHYSLMVDWNELERYITRRVKRSEMAFEEEGEDPVEVEIEDTTFDDVEDVTIKEGRPCVSILDPRDLLVLPATVDRLEDASVIAVALRMSEGLVQKYIDDGVFDEEQGELLMGLLGAGEDTQQPNTQKKATNNAGVKTDSNGGRTALVYMVWSRLKISDKETRMCLSYFAGADMVLSCTRNPYWNDKINVISMPAQKVAGSFWGKSRIEGGVEKMQYAANDAANMGFDSAQFALLPIVMTDPAANPKAGSMVLATAAIWEVDPKSTTFAQMPPVWKDAFMLIGQCKDQIQQSMSTNPAMMPNGAAAKKPTQAQIAQEQQVALESTADVVNIIEDGLFNQLIEWFYDLDYQYRNQSVMIKKFGPLGYHAIMEEVPPYQTGAGYRFRWFGSEGMKAAQEVQQMIAAANVLRGIPPQQLGGRTLDLGPVVDQLAKTAFGPRLAPNILKDERHQMTIDPEQENQMLSQQFMLPVSPHDNDAEHIKAHLQAAQELGDPTGYFRTHIMMHIAQMKMKQQAAAGQMGMGGPEQMGQQPGTPGSPPAGGAPGMPGQPGPPRIGAQPGQMRGVQNPPGAIHPDQMQDPNRMPN